jgi:hypothetical protein
MSSRLPAEWLRLARIAALVCAFTLVPYALLADAFFCFSPLVGGLAACVALGCAVAALRSSAHPDLPPHLRIGTRRLVKWLGLGAGLLICQASACLNVNMAFRETDWSIVASANLHGIALAVETYCNEQGVAPGSFDDLLLANLVTDRQLLSFSDPAAFPALAGAKNYSSFKLLPPPDPFVSDASILVAHERQPWSRGEWRLFSVRRRQAVFSDGHVQSLTEAEFDAALKADNERRAQLRPAR